MSWSQPPPNPRAWDSGDGGLIGPHSTQGHGALFPLISLLQVTLSKLSIIMVRKASVYYKLLQNYQQKSIYIYL